MNWEGHEEKLLWPPCANPEFCLRDRESDDNLSQYSQPMDPEYNWGQTSGIQSRNALDRITAFD